MNQKIGIATISLMGSSNYGNRLQAYALQMFLRKNGYDPLTIYYEADYVRRIANQTKESKGRTILKQSVLQSADDTLRILKRKLFRRKLEQLAEKRKRGFEHFAQNYITYTDRCYRSDSDFTELREKCSCFVTGSDQVWNPYYEGADGFSYLEFADEGKRIAYGPSIAVEQIPQAMKQRIGSWLRQIDFLSVRENAGKRFLKREFGLDARVVCDPVLLLNREQWHAIAQKPPIEGKYIAVYMLGKKTVEKKRVIRALRKQYRIPVLDIYTRDDPSSVFASPHEFLGMIENAEFVVTDSFHGLAFSAIFEKPVLVLPRYSADRLDSRLEDFLKILHVEEYEDQIKTGKYSVITPDYPKNKDFMDAFIEESGAYLLSAIRQCTQ